MIMIEAGLSRALFDKRQQNRIKMYRSFWRMIRFDDFCYCTDEVNKYIYEKDVILKKIHVPVAFSRDLIDQE
jgi:hypothetical protein